MKTVLGTVTAWGSAIRCFASHRRIGFSSLYFLWDTHKWTLFKPMKIRSSMIKKWLWGKILQMRILNDCLGKLRLSTVSTLESLKVLESLWRPFNSSCTLIELESVIVWFFIRLRHSSSEMPSNTSSSAKELSSRVTYELYVGVMHDGSLPECRFQIAQKLDSLL